MITSGYIFLYKYKYDYFTIEIIYGVISESNFKVRSFTKCLVIKYISCFIKLYSYSGSAPAN